MQTATEYIALIVKGYGDAKVHGNVITADGEAFDVEFPTGHHASGFASISGWDQDYAGFSHWYVQSADIRPGDAITSLASPVTLRVEVVYHDADVPF